MSDYRYMVQQYNSSEVARTKNKIENNRLANELRGKGGIEHERAFQLKSVELEKRRIQEELDAIRSHGRRRTARRNTKPEIFTTSLNPPLNKPEFRDRRPPGSVVDQRATLAGYYDIPIDQLVKVKSDSKLSPTQKTSKNYAGTHASTTSTGTLLPTQVGQPPKKEPIFIRFDPASKEKYSQSNISFQTDGAGENTLRNPAVHHKRHMVEFVEEDRLTHNKAGKTNRFGIGTDSVTFGAYGTSEAPVASDKSGRQVPGTNSKPSNIVTLNELSLSEARQNVARRLTDQGEVSGQTTAEKTQPDTTAAQSGIVNADASVNSEQTENMATKAPKEAAKDQDKRTRKDSKGEAVNDMLKGSKYDPDMYNPDGSLRTKHLVRPFDECYEQARNARYIRSKERAQLDRELSINEVFQRPQDSNSDKDSQTGSV